jgi:hypothetical protein
MKRTLRDIKKDLQELSSEQLQQVDVWLQKLLRKAEVNKRDPRPDQDDNLVMEEHQRGDKTYRLEYTRCGKTGCKCTTGNLHGPYWYAYWTEEGKTKSRYIGKKLPR